MANKTVIIIPSRYNSKRFPGKPLAKIKGLSLINRVWKIAKKVQNACDVIIATDNNMIYEHCKEFNAKVMMTSTKHTNGTERIGSVIFDNELDYEIIINLQGDAVLTQPHIIEKIIIEMSNNKNIQICTPAYLLNKIYYKELLQLKNSGIISGTTVTFSKSNKALYFSKNVIPFIRNKEINPLPVYKHIGIYGYRKNILRKLIKLGPSRLEICEGLEQLRALENDIPVNIVLVDCKDHTIWSVDNPEDINIIEHIIDKEGDIIKN